MSTRDIKGRARYSIVTRTVSVREAKRTGEPREQRLVQWSLFDADDKALGNSFPFAFSTVEEAREHLDSVAKAFGGDVGFIEEIAP